MNGYQDQRRTGDYVSFAKKRNNGIKDLCNVCTFGACKTIEDATELRGDEVMMIRIKGVD